MKTITTTAALSEYCEAARAKPYVTIDTEFLRERTYYSKLCLIQMAYPADSAEEEADAAVLIDPLAGDISLEPLYGLFRDRNVVKVFHAARQDLEIFYFDAGVFPEPLFDTQVAAMVCGFGEQAGYETLVRKIARQPLDKSSRFTDWSRRPLSEAQKSYALADVTHLRVIYEHLAAELKRTQRAHWLEEELGILTAAETYETPPEEAWKRVKTRSNSPRFLAIVRALAAFRERYAQEKNIPRNRVFKDDALVELASAKPSSAADLGKLRLLLRDARKGPIAEGILEAVAQGVACPQSDLPAPDQGRGKVHVNPALADLLRVLLKAKTEASGVAAKLIANSSDLDAIAAGMRDVPALAGWRREVFGEEALQLCEGRVALAAQGQNVAVIRLSGDQR